MDPAVSDHIVEPTARRVEIPRTYEPPPGAPASEPTLADVIDLIRRQRKLVMAVPLTLFLLVVVVSLVLPRVFEATALFMPQATDAKTSRLAGLAGQFGIALPLGDAGQPLGFYVELLKSREILTAIVNDRYTFTAAGQTRSGTLMDLFRVSGKTEALRRDAALRQLKRAVEVTSDPASGLVKVVVRTRWAPLSQRIVQRLLELVSEFNLRRRQTQAAAEREFVGGRLNEARAELDTASERLESFLRRNREYRNAPVLTFQYDRLSREVVMRQQLYTSLAQAYDQARMDEVRDTPVITTVERPDLPANPVSRHLILKGLVALLVGGMLGIGLAFGREMAPERHAAA
jgi:uncharacterized protein involved in exopolysaccharide biosynthesis